MVIFFRETVFRRYLLVYLAAWGSLKEGWGNTGEACMKTLTLCKTKKFHFITLFNSQEAFFSIHDPCSFRFVHRTKFFVQADIIE